jgi:hypothetical protein
MEGNPVWSNPNYANQLVISLPSLVKLDQQDVTQVLLNAEVRELVKEREKCGNSSALRFESTHVSQKSSTGQHYRQVTNLLAAAKNPLKILQK